MDALSETLRVVRLVGAIFIQARFTAPWCYQSPRADSLIPVLEPGAERVIIFHLITEGECYVELGDQATVRLTAGDVVVFPQGHAGIVFGIRKRREHALMQLDQRLAKLRVRNHVEIVVQHGLHDFLSELLRFEPGLDDLLQSFHHLGIGTVVAGLGELLGPGQHRLVNIRIHRTRAEHGYTNVVRLEIEAQRFRKTACGELGRAVDACSGQRRER